MPEQKTEQERLVEWYNDSRNPESPPTWQEDLDWLCGDDAFWSYAEAKQRIKNKIFELEDEIKLLEFEKKEAQAELARAAWDSGKD